MVGCEDRRVIFQDRRDGRMLLKLIFEKLPNLLTAPPFGMSKVWETQGSGVTIHIWL
jgi:hypothetical protein